MKTLKIADDTFTFLAWLARQDVTIPNLIVDYLKVNRYTKEQVKAYLHALNNACIEAQ